MLKQEWTLMKSAKKDNQLYIFICVCHFNIQTHQLANIKLLNELGSSETNERIRNKIAEHLSLRTQTLTKKQFETHKLGSCSRTQN